MDMLERAAEAAKQALIDDPETDAWVGGDDHFDALVVDGTIRLSPVVRAVLTAIREPSIEVVMAGANEVENGDGELHRRKWQAMIDAIIGDQ